MIDGSSTLNGGGGAIYLDKSASLILNNSAIKNVHTGSSGAIYANGNNQVLIMNSLIQSCVSDLSSAVLYASSPASISVNNSILDSNFGYSGWGGVVYVGGGGSLQITGVTLSNNVGLNSNGGAVYVDIGSTLAVQDSVFVNNTVGLNGQYGGAVYMFVNDGEPYPSFSNVTFTNNTAQEGGGLVLESDFDVTNISISNVNFNSNSAAVNGGGLLLLADLNNQVFNVFGQLPISFTGNTCMGCAADIALSTDNANNASLAFSGPASVSFDCPVGDDMITVLTDPNAVFLDSANGATVSTSSSAMIVCK